MPFQSRLCQGQPWPDLLQPLGRAIKTAPSIQTWLRPRINPNGLFVGGRTSTRTDYLLQTLHFYLPSGCVWCGVVLFRERLRSFVHIVNHVLPNLGTKTFQFWCCKLRRGHHNQSAVSANYTVCASCLMLLALLLKDNKHVYLEKKQFV